MNPHRIAKTSEQARHEIATAAVGLFIALAFALMGDGVKDAWKDTATHPAVAVDSIVFTLAAMSFFLGTQAWLWSDAIQTAPTPLWLYNFFFTLLTLIDITMMGAFVGTERIFYSWLFGLYAIQCVWILAGFIRPFRLSLEADRPELVLQNWWGRFAAIGMILIMLALIPGFSLHRALILFGVLRSFNLGFDLFYAVPRIWGQTEAPPADSNAADPRYATMSRSS